MAKINDVRRFDPVSFRSTVDTMKARGEDVHATGRRHLQETGELHPYVDVKQNRGSHNAMIPNDKGGFSLINGIAMPILSMFDGTGSTAHWLSDFFHAAERQYKLLEGARPRYNTQLASAVVQDVCDRTPVVQLSQFESDERSAEQVRLLQPDGGGGDATEDYDLGLAAGLFIYADLCTFYGLKGYFTITADEKGRGFVTSEDTQKYLGQSLDQLQGGKRLDTAEICRRLTDNWHVFMFQVPSGRSMLPHTTSWWTDVLGPGRVIQVPEPRLLAEARAGLVYVTEAAQPNKAGLTEFLQTGDQSINATDLDEVWQMLQAAKDHFGAQSKLPGYHEIPQPGDVFEHFRHAWPIGHPRQSENTSSPESAAS